LRPAWDEFASRTQRPLDSAIGLMMSLRQQAIDMASDTGTGGQQVGPSFGYRPVN
jgi:hypothetical protein